MKREIGEIRDIRYSEYFKKAFKKLHPEIQERISKKIIKMKDLSNKLYLKKIKSEESSSSVRVGTYRIIMIKHSELKYTLTNIGHRSNIYKIK